ncbi:MAG: dihydroorotate dehydrogenase electron transfer subunit [Acidobacteriota bacterium]|nr:dihydroorotate dehydrogenase electron transfer subunit [Acidobacteriota bacterium]
MLKDSHALITHKECWKDYYLFSLESPIIASQAQPGQFIMVRVSSLSYPLLRRPFSIHSVEGKNIEIFFQISGVGTSLLSNKITGDFMDIIGPLGKGFSWDQHSKTQDVVLIGGGQGIAPLYFLAQKLYSVGTTPIIFYGGKTKDDIPLKEKFEQKGFEIYCSTDDGSFGFRGLITDCFKDQLKNLAPKQIFACGPEPMMEAISQVATKKGIPAEFSLESVMGCGFGACWGCVKKIKTKEGIEWVKICEEGPVFSSFEIVWEGQEK